MEHSDRQESDQLPEEQPADAGVDDAGSGRSREEARESAGGADDEAEGQATGNPDNAG